MSRERLCCISLCCLWILSGTVCVPGGGGGGAGGGPNDNAPDNENDNTPANENDNVAGLPLPVFSAGAFAGSGNCAACHRSLTDDAGKDVSIDTAWRATMMANAAKDPFFLATVSSEVLRAPGVRGDIEDVCATCHMPMARTQALVDGTETLVQDEGFLATDNPLHAAAMDGVSCTLCHQVQADFLDDPESSFSGGYQIDTAAEPPDRVEFGPYTEPQFPTVMQAASGYLPVFGEHLTEAGLCATCHTVFTPTLDAAGEAVGTFPEQTPFLEWRHSSFGDGVGDDDRPCQDCHMAKADGEVAISSVPPNLEPRTPFFQHYFLGGNVFMLRLLRDNIEALELTASTANFNAGIAETERYLLEETAEISVADSGLSDGILLVTFEITNKTGHKFPTGFPSHRAWIHLVVTDSLGQVVLESGAPQSDGSVAGDDADEDASSLEPHYDVITMPDQVQIYQSVMANTDGEITYTLLRGASYAKDNRLLPQGFDKAAADGDIAVRGGAAEDDDFIGGSDRISYELDVAGGTGPFAISARLLYQSVSFRFAADVLEDTGELIDRFGEMYDAADKTPALVAAVGATIE